MLRDCIVKTVCTGALPGSTSQAYGEFKITHARWKSAYNIFRVKASYLNCGVKHRD